MTLDVDFDPPVESFETARSPVRAVNGTHRVVETPATDPDTYLLACCLLDPDDVMPRCEEAGVGPASFVGRERAEVFDAMRHVWRTEHALDVASLAAELTRRGSLTRLGGWPFLTSITPAVPTTVHAQSLVDGVQREYLRRELVRAADAASRGEDPDELIAGLIPRRSATVNAQSRPLTAFNLVRDGDRSILLGNRYLNRGDGAVLSSTSGMGKSSMSVQMAVLWALGRSAFGIAPNGALRSVIVQSEDSDGDVAEIWASIAHVLNLDADQLAAVQRMVVIVNDRTNRGQKFISSLRRLIAQHKPDLVWINPLQAFMDGDVTDSKDLGGFLREGLNGLNDPPSFGYVIVHHTTKPATGKDRADRLWHEVMYDMAGGAEIINWARAILSLRAAKAEGEFNLVLAKRGRRAGATRRKEQGAGFVLEPVTTIPLKHSTGRLEVQGIARGLPIIYWEGREPDEVADDEPKEKGGRAAKYNFSDYRNLVPESTEPGMELGPLHKRLETNKPISKSALHYALKRWAEEGMIEILEPEGRPARYRRAM